MTLCDTKPIANTNATAALKAEMEVAKEAAKVALLNRKEPAFAMVFTKEQIAAINKHCKKYDLNRDLMISEIITAGLGAKGIVLTNKKTG